MPELRKDPVVDRWVIISEERAARPMSKWVKARNAAEEEAFCPFCEGNEESTPPEVLSFRDDGSQADKPGWRLRAVPNKFPALRWDGDVKIETDGVYEKVNGVGVHEVIIETPRHDEQLACLPTERMADLFRAARMRILEFKRDKRLNCVQFFKNHGPESGASLNHSHSQIIAMPVASKHIKEEIYGSRRCYIEIGKCVYCDIIDKSLARGERIILENADFVAIAPFAPRFAYETLILPKEHSHRFEEIEDDAVDSLAEIFGELMKRVNALLDSPPYNMMLHTAPFDSANGESYHWHVELMPVLTRVAGFEWGSGFHINPVAPEEAARLLRKV